MTKSEKTMLGFILMLLSSALWPNLPSLSLIACVFAAFIFNLKYQWSQLFTGLLIGFLWASACAYYFIYWQLDSNYYEHNVVVHGQVLSLVPLQTDSDKSKFNKIKFTFRIDKIGDKSIWLSPQVRLSWYGVMYDIKQGDKLRLFVKLKPAVGLGNPDGFNYQTWLTSKNIVASGYVKDSPTNQLMAKQPSVRQNLIDELQQQNHSQMRWMIALSYGDRHLLKRDDWQILQQTGTAHLFAISGMHLGIVFACLLVFIKLIIKLYGVLIDTRIPAKQIVLMPSFMLVSSACCVFYAYLAGNEMPVMRALLSVIFCTLLVISKRYWRFRASFLALLSCFFILFPFSILGISFWFSFTAVMLIVLFVWRVPLPLQGSWYAKLAYAIKLQLFMSLATLPMIAITFSFIPISGFVANVVIAPIITFLLVPACLIASALSLLGMPTLVLYMLINEVFVLSFSLLHFINDTFNELMYARFDVPNNGEIDTVVYYLQQAVVLLILLLIFLPKWPGKDSLLCSIGGLFVMHVLLADYYPHNTQRWHMNVMDVGQGSAIIMQQQKHFMLYDTGNSFNDFSMAMTVLLPFFEAKRSQQLDYFVVSHLDNDHAGGKNVINKNLNVARFLSPAKGCNVMDASAQQSSTSISNSKVHYLFGTLTIQVLWPLSPISGEHNNHSCVLRISDGKHSILLTGDIEKQAEAQILHHYRDTGLLKSDVLVAPHHGSKTSSTIDFIKAVAPVYVVFTSGYRNRWGFPNQDVLKRYQSVNAKVLITGKQGRIHFTFDENDMFASSYRDDEYDRWYFKAR